VHEQFEILCKSNWPLIPNAISAASSHFNFGVVNYFREGLQPTIKTASNLTWDVSEDLKRLPCDDPELKKRWRVDLAPKPEWNDPMSGPEMIQLVVEQVQADSSVVTKVIPLCCPLKQLRPKVR